MIPKRSLNKVIRYLKTHPHPVAQTTAKLLKLGEVKIYLFGELSRKQLRFFFPSTNSLRLRTKRRLLNDVHQRFQGCFQAPHFIIINDALLNRIDTLTETLVHECNHYLNKADPYQTDEDKFYSEYKAFLAQSLFRGDLEDNQAHEKALDMLTKYYPNLPVPTPLKSITGIFS